MAIKSGLDFFPLDVCLDKKFELIEAEYGLTGFGVIVHLLQEIYGKEGYYIEWTEEVALLFARRCGLGGSVVSEIIEAVSTTVGTPMAITGQPAISSSIPVRRLPMPLPGLMDGGTNPGYRGRCQTIDNN